MAAERDTQGENKFENFENLTMKKINGKSPIYSYQIVRINFSNDNLLNSMVEHSFFVLFFPKIFLMSINSLKLLIIPMDPTLRITAHCIDDFFF